MKNLFLALIFLMSIVSAQAASKYEMPWQHGNLTVSSNGHYLQHANGTPFFWLGDTGWLLPQKLTRSEAENYLTRVADAGYNVVQIQVLNGVPSINAYGQLSHIDGWDFNDINRKGTYGYWDHLDYIVDLARQRGIYVAMVCIWGGLVKGNNMDQSQAEVYGRFLADRYKDKPNIIWVIGGDIKGDVKPEVWSALAESIKSGDSEHIMTFHPFGRTSSAYWWHNADWLDMNMFQSGHRRYDQTRGDGDDTASAAVAEDNWRYVEDGIRRTPHKPIIDGEPSYEGIPQGLHDLNEPRWQAHDARRYAYWSVFAGAAGHTYGNNSIMQMYHPGEAPAYGAQKPWYEALDDEGFNQMQYLKRLMLSLPYFERVPDQSVIISANGQRYDRAVATRGNDYLLVYIYNVNTVEVDLSQISGTTKNLWWLNPTDGTLEFIGQSTENTAKLHPAKTGDSVCDRVLIAIDADKPYLSPSQKSI